MRAKPFPQEKISRLEIVLITTIYYTTFPYLFDSSSPAVSHLKRETTRVVGTATRLFIRMRHFFTTGVIKPTELLSLFEKKQEKLVNTLNFCSVKITSIVFHIKDVTLLLILKPRFLRNFTYSKSHLLK